MSETLHDINSYPDIDDLLIDAVLSGIVDANSEDNDTNQRKKPSLRHFKNEVSKRDSIGRLLDQIGETELLTPEEELEHFKRVEAGVYAKHLLDAADESTDARHEDLALVAADGEAARKHLVEANLKWVVSNAKNFTGRDLPLDELVNAGTLGLYDAIEHFDYAKGFRFTTFSVWYIRLHLQKTLGAERAMSPQTYVNVLKLGAIEMKIKQETGEDPTPEQLSKEMGMSIVQLENLRKRREHRDLRIDQPVGEDEGSTVGEFIEEGNATHDTYSVVESNVVIPIAREAITSVVRDVLEDEAMLPHERRVIMDLFGMNKDEEGKILSLVQIAEREGWGKNKTTKIKAEAIAKVRDGLAARAVTHEVAMDLIDAF